MKLLPHQIIEIALLIQAGKKMNAIQAFRTAVRDQGYDDQGLRDTKDFIDGYFPPYKASVNARNVRSEAGAALCFKSDMTQWEFDYAPPIRKENPEIELCSLPILSPFDTEPIGLGVPEIGIAVMRPDLIEEHLQGSLARLVEENGIATVMRCLAEVFEERSY